MIYLPIDEFNNTCYQIISGDIIRAYNDPLIVGEIVGYTDYYVNSHYIKKNDTLVLETVPSCIPVEDLTNSYVYRNDFSDICIIFSCIFFLTWFLFSKVFNAFRKGF